MRALPRPRLVDSAPPDDDRRIEDIYRAHVDTVVRWVRHLAGPAADVEDLVHEVFLVAQRRLPAFRGDAAITTWLHRITENVVRTARRKERGRRWIRRLHGEELGSVLAPSPSLPGEDLERRQEMVTLYRALDRLPDKYRSLLIMFEMEAMSGEQLAALTGLRPQTVRVRLHRARKLFLKTLAELEPEVTR